MVFGILRKNGTVRRLEGIELEEVVDACKGRHKCKSCAYEVFFKCPKVMHWQKSSLEDPQNYPFIEYGLQVYNEDGLKTFVVVDCENFQTEHQRPAKERALKELRRTEFWLNRERLSDFYLDEG